jgi:hypothetical protein
MAMFMVMKGITAHQYISGSDTTHTADLQQLI